MALILENQMSIYVAEDNETPRDKEDIIEQDGKDQLAEYEDYSQEEEEVHSAKDESAYGHKIKSRN